MIAVCRHAPGSAVSVRAPNGQSACRSPRGLRVHDETSRSRVRKPFRSYGPEGPRRLRDQVESPGPGLSTAGREGGEGAGSRSGVQARCELRICIHKCVPSRRARKVGRACGNESAVASPNCEKAVQGPRWFMDTQKDRAAGKPFRAFAQRCMDAAPSLITQGGSRGQRPCSTPPLTCGAAPALEGKE